LPRHRRRRARRCRHQPRGPLRRGPVNALLVLAAMALRLPDGARPVHYDVELTVVPTEDRFTGAVDIDLELAAPAETVWLHGHGRAGGRRPPARGGGPAPPAPAPPPAPPASPPAPPLAAGPARPPAGSAGATGAPQSIGLSRERPGDASSPSPQPQPISARR